MFEILGILQINGISYATLKGNRFLIEKGCRLVDEHNNQYLVGSIALTHFSNSDDFSKYIQVALTGDVDNIGEFLFISMQ